MPSGMFKPAEALGVNLSLQQIHREKMCAFGARLRLWLHTEKFMRLKRIHYCDYTTLTQRIHTQSGFGPAANLALFINDVNLIPFQSTSIS